MKKLILFILVLTSIQLGAQHRVGVRAGLNYSTFRGPVEQGEDYAIGNGFHFGINYTYELNDIFGIRGEILYVQRGAKQNYFSDDTYHIIRSLNINKFVEQGMVDLKMDISNAYLSIPVTAQLDVGRKLEIFGGMSVDFLVGPSGRGKLDFTSRDRPDDIFFIQSYDHRYNSDEAGEYNVIIPEFISIIVDGDRVELPKVVGAYYNFDSDQKTGKRFNTVDAHLIFGGNYFINPGFYIGARLEYGLTDITNDQMDYSLSELDADENFIFREDKDSSMSLSISFGFRF
ncbi:MAG: PorT family protein [Saprospiraceae bacterium]|nr:PorT family protein [Bacteroidia bacterium]NNF20957.1 PorT family protein [Saprospiraceae bacterium]